MIILWQWKFMNSFKIWMCWKFWCTVDDGGDDETILRSPSNVFDSAQFNKFKPKATSVCCYPCIMFQWKEAYFANAQNTDKRWCIRWKQYMGQPLLLCLLKPCMQSFLVLTMQFPEQRPTNLLKIYKEPQHTAIAVVKKNYLWIITFKIRKFTGIYVQCT